MFRGVNSVPLRSRSLNVYVFINIVLGALFGTPKCCVVFFFSILEDRDNEGRTLRCWAGLSQDDWGWGVDGERLEAQEALTLRLPALAALVLGLL